MAVTAGLRLGRDAIRHLPIGSQPLIRPGDAGVGIVHLGLGAFHRAHQAVYTERAMAAAGGDWGIVAVAPRSRDLVEALTEQDLLFSVTDLDGASARARAIGSLVGVRHAASDPAAIVELLARPEVRVVTLTVTEKAYQLDPATGRLRPDADLAADLASDRPPRTVPGLLLRGLLARFRADAGPIALVSCDNLPANGARLEGVVTGCLDALWASAPAGPAAYPAGVIDWVRTHVTFPSTMVDRIVPASTAATRDRAADLLGMRDEAAVAAEPFSQWVIEDRFPGGRPAWDRAGAVLTADAGPWERLKLRALNGAHSTLAYLGALAGAETIAEALTLPGLREAVQCLLTEDVAPSLTPPDGASVEAYGASVLTRFDNAAIGHRTLQVALDGSQKLPQRILATMLDRRAAGGTPRWAALAVAAWIRFAQGTDDSGRPLPLDDPLAEPLRAAATGSDPVGAVLALSQVFPAELAADPVVRGLIRDWLDALTRHGVAETLREASCASP